ncbi:MAG TPA: single-stranded DNA-binding protein [Bryobacteraceae bacterium]|jgi:single-strand DNA-binding protein|nr:single-stranded DNA-binding protein [Bryobacteraceae bacterium]
MQKNSVELIGYLGRDAEIKQANNSNFTLLSVATSESWKSKETGERQSRTEWHSVICAGKLGEYAVTLQKGAFVQIEGALRSKPYQVEAKGSTSKKPLYKTITTWYIRADVIRRLDRNANASQDDTPAHETPDESAPNPSEEVPF